MSSTRNYDTREIFGHFDVYGDFTEALPYGNGHINDTFAVSCLQAGEPVRYILQRLNHEVFREPVKLMENIDRICRELHKRLLQAEVADASRRALTTVPSRSGLPYHRDKQGNIWRLYLFIEGARGYDVVETEEQAYQAARAFGGFQKLLTDLPGERLHETIPGFHDTPRRFRRFEEVVAADPRGLKNTAGPEIDFFLGYRDQVSRLIDLRDRGLIPERVTHNDTKLNNVLLDEITHEAVCVIDLDTSMPGLSLYDFGDLVRTSTTTSPEDEPDLSRVTFQPEMFKALTRGYLSEAAVFLTPDERDNLVFGGILMTYEVGLRFLTDYLEGNVYFKTRYPDHSLVRCRTQMALVKAIESCQEELEQFVREEYGRVLP